MPQGRGLATVIICLLVLQVLLVIRRGSQGSSKDQILELEHRLDKSIELLNQNQEGIQKVTSNSQPRSQQGEQLRNISSGQIFESGNEDGECVGGRQSQAESAIAAVVSVTFDRADYLHRHLDSLLGVHGTNTEYRNEFPLYVSQDGPIPNQGVAELAKSFATKGVNYLHHKEETVPVKLTKKENVAYYRIANHYKFILYTLFDCFGYKRLIIVEDDMELAPDFFSYFKATSTLLDNDPTLYCVSSWNDHGQKQFVRSETQLHRSDFFPGLGWMINKQLWDEVRSDWPHSYWDDWMRLNKTRKDRQCIRPEVCRTYNFGALGASKGQYFKRFLAPIRLSTGSTDWSKQNTSYLHLPVYDEILQAALQSAKHVGSIDEAINLSGDVLVEYDSQEHYEALTGRLGLLREWRDGIPRGSYKGVVIVHYNEAQIYLAKSSEFKAETISSDGNVLVRVDRTGALIRRGKLPRPMRIQKPIK